MMMSAQPSNWSFSDDISSISAANRMVLIGVVIPAYKQGAWLLR